MARYANGARAVTKPTFFSFIPPFFLFPSHFAPSAIRHSSYTASYRILRLCTRIYWDYTRFDWIIIEIRWNPSFFFTDFHLVLLNLLWIWCHWILHVDITRLYGVSLGLTNRSRTWKIEPKCLWRGEPSDLNEWTRRQTYFCVPRRPRKCPKTHGENVETVKKEILRAEWQIYFSK